MGWLFTVTIFLSHTAAMVIPQSGDKLPQITNSAISSTSVDDKNSQPTNKQAQSMTSTNIINPPINPYILLPSMPTLSTTSDSDFDSNPDINSNSSSSSSSSSLPTTTTPPSLLQSTSRTAPRKKVLPPPCPYPRTRPCITQKEVDQGWHDIAGCYNTVWIPIFTFVTTKCWEAGDDCVMEDCRY